MFKIFCLLCGSNCCIHVQKSHTSFLSQREIQIIQMLADINILTMKELAFKLNIAHGTLKVYLTRIYEKVKLPGGTQRNLLLWAFVNQEKLGITVPYKEAL